MSIKLLKKYAWYREMGHVDITTKEKKMKNILELLKTNLTKEGVSLENLKFKTHPNQILSVKTNGLVVTIAQSKNIFCVAVADEEGDYGSIADVFSTVENAVEYATTEIREMLNFPGSMKEMLFDCNYLNQ